MSAADPYHLGGQFAALRAAGEIDDGSPCQQNDPRKKCADQQSTGHPVHGHSSEED